MEKIVCSANRKNKKACSENRLKNGVIWGKTLLVPFPERKEKVCFWLGVKKEACTGEKNDSLPSKYRLVRALVYSLLGWSRHSDEVE